ncbi:MAG: 4-hydroxy-3-methylbut-2-en-1-yl diphosphate synthase, partial [Candidatus Cloacimonetes bacterium HGW-Cloacimonetes-1]
VPIGGNAPITIQSMLNTSTADIDASLRQIRELEDAGCDIIRFTVMNTADAEAIIALRQSAQVPLVADIHYDYRLALKAIANGIDGLRINPGNIGSHDKVMEVVSAAKDRNIPIRIGVNSGSLPTDLLAKYGMTSTAMVESALRHVRILEDLNYPELKISVKASSIDLMVESYRELSRRVDYPLHLGITEAGTMQSGTIKSSIALGILLSEGIGDTLRVSLTADPVQEVIVAKEILKALKLRDGINIVSCPTCGRTKIDLIRLAQNVELALVPYVNLPITVAVMGCAVNGPGEAREADYGIAGGIGEGLIFAQGEIKGKYPEALLIPELLRLISQDYPLPE